MNSEIYKKVMDGLECCTHGVNKCAICPYDPRYNKIDEINARSCMTQLAMDALKLLKEQETRVMTLEEIPEYDGAFLIEYRHEVWPMQWALFRLNLTTAYRFIRGDSELGFSINKDFYGKTWRCWTSRPTEEQRKATPWAEPPKEG